MCSDLSKDCRDLKYPLFSAKLGVRNICGQGEGLLLMHEFSMLTRVKSALCTTSRCKNTFFDKVKSVLTNSQKLELWYSARLFDTWTFNIQATRTNEIYFEMPTSWIPVASFKGNSFS